MSASSFGDGHTGRQSLKRFAVLGAPAMAVLWIGGTLIAVLMFPSFNWTTDTLAQVGRTGEPTAPLFDGSLFIGSLFGIIFLWQVSKQKTATLQRVGLALMGALIFLVGAGQLGFQQPWLLLIVLSIIFGTPVAIGLYGTGEIFAGNLRLGVLSFWLGIAHIMAWSIISNLLEFSSAIPTFATIVLLSIWSLTLYRQREDQ